MKPISFEGRKKSDVIMGIVMGGSLLLVGLLVIGSLYGEIDFTSLPGTAETKANDSFNKIMTAFTFTALGLMVSGAMSIIGAIFLYLRRK